MGKKYRNPVTHNNIVSFSGNLRDGDYRRVPNRLHTDVCRYSLNLNGKCEDQYVISYYGYEILSYFFSAKDECKLGVTKRLDVQGANTKLTARARLNEHLPYGYSVFMRDGQMRISNGSVDFPVGGRVTLHTEDGNHYEIFRVEQFDCTCNSPACPAKYNMSLNYAKRLEAIAVHYDQHLEMPKRQGKEFERLAGMVQLFNAVRDNFTKYATETDRII